MQGSWYHSLLLLAVDPTFRKPDSGLSKDLCGDPAVALIRSELTRLCSPEVTHCPDLPLECKGMEEVAPHAGVC